SSDFGKVSFTQNLSIWHENSTDADDTQTLTLNGVGEFLRLTQTLTDADGDTDSASFDLVSAANGGSSIFSIKDDGPDAVATATTGAGSVALPTLTLDETTNLSSGVRSTSASFLANFDSDSTTAGVQTDYGNDGAGSMAFALSLSADGIGSGLFAIDSSDTETTVDGYGKGAEILLFNNNGTIEGRTASSTGTQYFSISVNSDSSSSDFGKVSFTQNLSIWHEDAGTEGDGDHDDIQTLTLNGVGEFLRLTQTLTDADGDTDSASFDLVSAANGGSSIFSIKDDGPDAVATATTGAGSVALPTLTLDETTNLSSGVRSTSASFLANFDSDSTTAGVQTDYGNDGAGSMAFALSLSSNGIGSGLFAIQSSDTDPGTETDSDADGYGQGDEILLYNIDGVIEGRTGRTFLENGDVDNQGTLYFSISVNSDSSDTDDFGKVSFTQNLSIWHEDAGTEGDGDHDDIQTLTLNGVGEFLRLTQTLTDADGDTDSASFDLVSAANGGSSIFSIKDDGPDAVATATTGAGSVALPTLTLDETTNLSSGVRSTSASFLANFDSDSTTAGVQTDYGNDGAGSMAFALSLS
ncbi:MAG: DUF5801 repeats-in-toxin domain-containing protein, partial [Pontimonas sp.]